ncbi:PPOX class F420-dependent oxidoreductase [Marinitenerispora sediminis]|uniref:PPOX class F420-dependent oxidoreductase n=1 Tax=Marinitenerispora sediminis TaxID=1931232 RepID=A0A368T6P5_9ACTN|nr:PPOX class F420-dependent oxidoreductase [Marinitenerispora sediminis]RCV52535.1 PPOX class F420-dependent oxidoreductase [Marinitenerispora sediminis]RCV59494.1 PPOX class F420-dependent oxidoreductase [Marinitenerispora sediminis]RCV59601.1 PPOX class F420-dependent oxidoreductase [Marinitenerispora sediminis]
MPILPEQRADILGKRAFAHVATLGPRGEPQSNPVWVDWDGEFVKFSQTTDRQKYRNVRRDPRIALSAHDPDEPHQYLEIRGTVERIEDDTDRSFINSLASKYLGQDVYPWDGPDTHRVVVYVRPEHTTWQ